MRILNYQARPKNLRNGRVGKGPGEGMMKKRRKVIARSAMKQWTMKVLMMICSFIFFFYVCVPLIILYLGFPENFHSGNSNLIFIALVCSVTEGIEGAEKVPKKRKLKKKTEEGSENSIDRDRLDSEKSLVIGSFFVHIEPDIYLFIYSFLLLNLFTRHVYNTFSI